MFVNLGIGIEVFFPVFLFAEAVVLKKKMCDCHLYRVSYSNNILFNMTHLHQDRLHWFVNVFLLIDIISLLRKIISFTYYFLNVLTVTNHQKY